MSGILQYRHTFHYVSTLQKQLQFSLGTFSVFIVYAPYTAAIKNLLPINLPNFIQIIHIYTRIYTFIHLLYTLDFREY